MRKMTEYLSSNLINAETLELGVRYRHEIVEVRERDFEKDGVKPVVYFEFGEGCVLNQTRLRVCIGAFGPNDANWLGKTIIYYRGKTIYGGKEVACIVFEPVIPAQIAAAKPQPALEGQPSRMQSIRKPAEEPPAPPPETQAQATPAPRQGSITVNDKPVRTEAVPARASKADFDGGSDIPF